MDRDLLILAYNKVGLPVVATAALIHPSFQKRVLWFNIWVIPCTAIGELCKLVALWAVTFSACIVTLCPISKGICVAKFLMQLCVTVTENVSQDRIG